MMGGDKLSTYETIFILDPSLDEHGVQKEIDKVEELITGRQGKIIKTEKWGLKKFSYPISKKTQGFYTLIYFEGEGNLPSELERSYKLNESCLRYLTVVSEGITEDESKDETKEEPDTDSSPDESSSSE
jgi:small subunit ribosomal protein S6